MNKKGQGLSLNTIIVAAIVLIVLVVLWAIFTGRMGIFTSDLQERTAPKDCPADAPPASIEECADPVFGNYNVGDGEVCCKELLTT